MQEKNIFKISLIIIFIGLTFLFLYSGEIDLRAIKQIETEQIEEKVQINGVINKLTLINKTYFILLDGYKKETTNIILFNDENIFLKEGDFVEVSGTVEEYHGKKEIISNKIIKK